MVPVERRVKGRTKSLRDEGSRGGGSTDTTPKTRTTRYPGTSNMVVVMTPFVSVKHSCSHESYWVVAWLLEAARLALEPEGKFEAMIFLEEDGCSCSDTQSLYELGPRGVLISAYADFVEVKWCVAFISCY